MTQIFDSATFTKSFPSEATCVAFLEISRWPDGQIISPYGNGDAYRLTTRPGLYKCRSTRQTFTVRHGTLFEDSRLPLRKWFYAIFILSSLGREISSVQLAKHLGVTQRTAWYMLQRIRAGIEQREFWDSGSETDKTTVNDCRAAKYVTEDWNNVKTSML